MSQLFLIAVMLFAPMVDGIEPIAPRPVDPDIGWALTMEPTSTSRVMESVRHYFDDPDLNAPACWEDEAIVVVVDHAHPDYGQSVPPQVGLIGCVPLDDLPVMGYRPEQ